MLENQTSYPEHLSTEKKREGNFSVDTHINPRRMGKVPTRPPNSVIGQTYGILREVDGKIEAYTSGTLEYQPCTDHPLKTPANRWQ